METHTSHLTRRRYELQARCALQRQEMAYLGRKIESQLATADRAISFTSGIAKRPIVVIAAIAGTMLLGPWRVLRWIGQGALLFTAVRKAWRLLA